MKQKILYIPTCANLVVCSKIEVLCGLYFLLQIAARMLISVSRHLLESDCLFGCMKDIILKLKIYFPYITCSSQSSELLWSMFLLPEIHLLEAHVMIRQLCYILTLTRLAVCMSRPFAFTRRSSRWGPLCGCLH